VSLLDEMRSFALMCKEDDLQLIHNKIHNWIHRLETYFLLVGIPIGEPVVIDDLENGWFVYDQKLYKVVSETRGVDWRFGEDLEGKGKAIKDWIKVQPIDLISIKDAKI